MIKLNIQLFAEEPPSNPPAGDPPPTPKPNDTKPKGGDEPWQQVLTSLNNLTKLLTPQAAPQGTEQIPVPKPATKPKDEEQPPTDNKPQEKKRNLLDWLL